MPETEFQDLKNKFKIFYLVKNHFSLTDESLKLFKYRLFYEPLIAKEFKEIIGEKKDFRKRIPLDEKLVEQFDNGWKIFQENFSYFIEKNKINYNHYKKNKITINGQEVKIKKVIEDFYIKNISYATKDLGFGYYETINEETITKKIRILLEKIGTMKIPNKKLEIVFSLNFADWFLCSAGEKWTSCISLDSSYERAFWSGLPGLVGDKNRAMVYITDGVKKNYNGIIVDRIISRSWVTIIRSKSKDTINKTFLTMVREYPNYLGITNMTEKAFNIKFYGNDEDCHPESYIGRYYIELFWHKITNGEFLNSIYFDNLSIKMANKNVAEHHKFGTYGRYVRGSGSSSYSRKEDKKPNYTDEGFNYSGGLKRLINGKVWKTETKGNRLKKIADFYERNDSYYDEDDGYGDEEENY
jgi:hypothetical protein